MYTEKDMVTVARRENNKKRNYLIVNKLQAKHIPVNPCESLKMFEALADTLKGKYDNENVLVTGFAETATAIGSVIAGSLGSRYIQTTREEIRGAEYLYFSEEHSHASEQKLVINNLKQVIENTDRIIFAEDEVTTGNTILNIINVINSSFGVKLKYAVVSLINGMSREAEERFAAIGIPLHYLVKTDNSRYVSAAERFRGDGAYHSADITPVKPSKEIYISDNYINARKLTSGQEYIQKCRLLAEEIISQIPLKHGEEVLVLGTEEFMYPAVYTGSVISEYGFNVYCHSSTRSPIEVSTEKEYPLKNRFELVSFYDNERTTFIYNLRKYDKVIVITDSGNTVKNAEYSLINALKKCGNEDIYIVRWGMDNGEKN